MNNQRFIELAAISALKGILSNPNIRSDYMDASKKAMLHAESLLLEMRKTKYSIEENDINQYIMDVDEAHAKKEIELQKKIEDLEYLIQNLTKAVEDNCPGWINALPKAPKEAIRQNRE